MYKEQITRYLNENRENIVRDICSLIKIPSVTGTNEALAALKACENMLSGVADSTELYENDLYALGKIKGSEKNIGIFAHCDVVPADEREWDYTKPFEPLVSGNCVIGRGAEDDKGGFIQGLYALKCIKELKLPLKSSVTFFVGASEEAGGMKDIISFTQNHHMPHISFSPDCEFPFSTGEKSIIHLTARAKNPLLSITSIEGGTVINAVAAKARAVLTTDEVVEAEGISAHAAMPEGSKNAITLLCERLCENPSVCDEDKVILEELAAMQSDFYGSHIGVAANEEGFGRLTCVMGKISSENSVVDFTLDLRFGAGTDINETAKYLEKYLEKVKFSILEIELSEGFTLSGHPAKDALAKVYSELGFKEKPFVSPGGTYSRHLKNSFSIGVVCGENESDIKLPSGKGGPHQSDEMVCVDKLLNGINVMVNYLLCVDGII